MSESEESFAFVSDGGSLGRYEYQFSLAQGTKTVTGAVFNLTNTQVAIDSSFLYSLQIDAVSTLYQRNTADVIVPIGLPMLTSYKNLALTPDNLKAIMWNHQSKVKVVDILTGTEIASHVPNNIPGGLLSSKMGVSADSSLVII